MKKIIITDLSTIYSALQKLQDSSGTCLIVTDKKKKLLGTLSDGDVRRAILRGKKLSDKVKDICRKNAYLFTKIQKT